jgi:tetratricopeptide (TPR) repeat protein
MGAEVRAGSAPARAATLGVCALLALAVLAVFGQTLGYGFLNFDDGAYVHENPLVSAGLTRAGVAAAFGGAQTFTWHPLTTLSHMLDCELFGLAPWGHHLTSILLHAATAVGLFLVLRRLTGAAAPGFFAALFFAIHPQRVESVAWISERKDVLSGFFFVLTLGAYERYARAHVSGARFPLGRYLLVLAGSALALASKPMVVTLPFVLLLLDWWPLCRLQGALGRRSLEKLPLLALSALVSAVTLATQAGAMTPEETLPLGARLENAVVAYAVYLRQLVYPVGLALVYPHPRAGLAAGTVLLSVLVLALVTAAAIALRRRQPFLLFGWLWFLGMLIPVIGLVQVGIQSHADRYTYLPHVGLYVLLCWGVASYWPERRLARGWALVPGAVAAGACLFLARAQVAHWRSSEELWRHTLACTSENSVAHAQLGVALQDAGRVDEAVEHYRRALAIQPDYATPRYNLGNVLAARGDLDGAIEQYRLAIAARADYGKAHTNLGAALAARGRTDEAIACFRRALELEPASSPARNGLGQALARRGELDGAIAVYREALRLDPRDAEAHGNLGIALGTRGQLEEALAELETALALEPDSPTRQGNLGLALELQGQRPRALEHYQRALALAEARGDQALAAVFRARLQGGPPQAPEH